MDRVHHDAHTLPLTTDGILTICPRFRILLVGRSGVGKSSLINHAFSVDIATVEHRKHGVCDINVEIMSPQNEHFVLHDSQGFEAGESTNLETVKKFLKSRGEGMPVKDRVHAIWHCIETPFAGGRVFETGDEDLLRLGIKVPIVVVFTKFDQLVALMEKNLSDEDLESASEDADLEKLCAERAEVEFENLCVKSLEDVCHGLTYAKTSVTDKQSLANLIDLTQDLVEKEVEGDVWIVSAMAQRASALAKINSSIAVGMQKYWHGLASGLYFSDSALVSCLFTIHRDITSTWNFNDPKNLLNGEYVQDRIKALTQLVTPDPSQLSSWFNNELQTLQALMGVVVVFGATAPPVVAAIGLSGIFVRWIARVYQQTPAVLRCLMGYIVNLTLVLDELFLITLAIKPPRILTKEQVDMALENYTLQEARKVHQEIREYVGQGASFTGLSKSNAAEKVEVLIRSHRGDAAKAN